MMIAAAAPPSRQVHRLVAPCVAHAAATPGADRYRKHFPAAAHLWLLLWHGLRGRGSLRRTFATLAAIPGLFARIGLRDGLSFSQLARSSTSRPAACFETLLDTMTARATRMMPPDPAGRLLRKVQVIDSTFVTLSAQLSPWSQHGGHAPGVRVHTALDLARTLPTRIWFHLADTHDHAALMQRDLAPFVGWTLVLDLGYYGHGQLARLRRAGVSFLSRLHPQAAYQVTRCRAVPAKPTPEGDILLADVTITLGSPNNRAGGVLSGLRLITSRNATGQCHQFVTDRFDLTAPELVRLYRKRWQIELFFRFLKHHLGLCTPLGHSRAALWLTLLLVTIIAVLLTLVDAHRPPPISRIAWLGAIGSALQARFRGS